LVTGKLYEGAYAATLESGMRLLVEEVPTSRSVSVGIWVKVGSRDDPAPASGLAHALEHLLFKGTTSRDALRIAQEIDAVGGHLNGATGEEATFLYADVPSDGVETALELLSDLVLHPAFDPSALEKERGVILEEIRGFEDDPEQYAFELFNGDLWEAGHPLSRSVLGERSTIERLTPDQAAAHHCLYYRPEKMVLVACGAVDARRVVEMAERLFPAYPPSGEVSPRVAPHLSKGRAFHERETGQTHLYLGLPGAPAADPDRIALEVVNAVLGGGPSSRLFRLIREDRGLAYAVSSTATYYSDVGAWIVYAGVGPEHVGEVAEIALQEVRRLAKDGLSLDDLALARAKLRGGLILSLESNPGRMVRLGGTAVAGRKILSPDELITRVERITGEDTSRAIARFARLDEARLSVIGPRTDGVEKVLAES